VSRGQWTVMVVAAAGAGVIAVVDRRALVVLAALALVVSAVRSLPSTPDLSSRWRRGWSLVAFAVVPGALSVSVGGVSPVLRTSALLLTSVLVLVGIVGALPSREPARARELVMEATIGGGLCAYLVGALGRELTVLELIAVAVGASAWWLLALLLLRERDQVTVAARWLAAAFATLLIAHHLVVLAPGGRVGDHLARFLAGAAVLAWAVACGRPELRDAVPPALAPAELLHRGHVRVVVAGVLAGPAAVTVSWALGRDEELVPLVAGGGVLAMVAVLHLLQLVRDHGRRAWLARHDALTGLPTEPLFEDRLERAMARGRRTGSGFTVAFVDLDGFKRVNDRDGHEAGDRVLRAVGARLRRAVREDDTVARRSGDEFLLLLEGLEDGAVAERVATKLLDALGEPISVDGRQHRLGASVGLARWPRDGTDADELMRHADAAMYDAKERGSGSVRWYSSAASSRSRLRLTLGRQLELAAADGDQLELAFHPRVDLRDGRVVELVALVRWRHPELGLLLPGSFLPFACEAGLHRVVDVAILELACATVRRWHEDGLLEVPVVVHVTDASAGHPQLEEDVVAVLRRTGLAPPHLGLAITETGVARAGARGRRSISDLAELGVRTTLTRFGTGSAGIGALAELPLGAFELAAPLVTRLGAGSIPPVVDAALALADRLAVPATAGGVETAEQAERLRAAGCGTARGPHLAPPALAGTLERRLRQLVGRRAGPGPLLASELAGEGLPGAEQPEVAAVLAATASPDAEVDERALADVLARLRGGAPA
jgi:diguanylate cyclase (GGDEF)-like protein